MNPIQSLKELSDFIADRIDIIQGAGGNTSVKTVDGEMLIKASGKNIKDVSSENAFVSVQIKDILDVLCNDDIDITNQGDVEKINGSVKNSVIENNVTSALLMPSMETSFHCLFYTYTLHTHNMYANIFLCSDHFHLLENCFTGDENYEVSLMENYFTPGAELSWYIWDTYRFAEKMPNVLFLPNHGVIYSHNSLSQLKEIHNDVQQKLLSFLQIEEKQYPSFEMITHDNHSIECICPYLLKHFSQKNWDFIFEDLLFPDQAIYLRKNDFSKENALAKVFIDDTKKKIYFNTTKKEATTIAELCIACYFVMEQILGRNYEPLTINYEWDKLRNMSNEKHRINQMKN